MNAIKNIIEKASKLNGTVVLPEGMDPRVITAACACVDRKIATPVVLGTPAEIAAADTAPGAKDAEPVAKKKQAAKKPVPAKGAKDSVKSAPAASPGKLKSTGPEIPALYID